MRRLGGLWTAIVAVVGWSSPQFAAADTDIIVQLQGDPGAALLDNGFRTITNATHSLVDLTSSADQIHFRLESPLGGDLFWPDFDFAARPGEPLIGTHHFDVYDPKGAANATVLVQSVQSPCSYGEGWFHVYEYARNPVDGITRLSMEFQFRCGGYTGILRGKIYINSLIGIPSTELTALPNGPREVNEGDTVQLEGKWSRRGAQFPIDSYSWRQVSGPTVQLLDASTAEPSFIAVTPSTTTSVARFELTVQDSGGNTAVGFTETSVVGRDVAKTFIALQSDSTEYVLRGQSITLRAPETTIQGHLSLYERQELVLSAESPQQGFHFNFAAPEGQPLTVGNYDDAGYPAAPNDALLNFGGNGSQCNGDVGRFSIYELQVNATTHVVEKLALDFDRRCNSNPDSADRAYGQIRINSSYPRVRVTPLASAGEDRIEAEQTSVMLDGTGSRAGQSPITSYAWTQTAGPPVALGDPGAAQPQFMSPAVANGSVTLTFQLRVTDSAGNSDVDTMNIQILSSSQPRNVMRVDGRQGDFIGQGRYLTLDDDDGRFVARRDPDGTIVVAIDAGFDSFRFDVRAPNGGALVADDYENASSSPTHPGIEASSDGHGCRVSTGRFIVREIVVPPGTDIVERLAVDLEHRCDEETETLLAYVRFNSSVPLTVADPTAVAGGDQVVMERARINLDGRNSRGGNGTISSWQWRQLAGPTVTLTNATTGQAQFDAPVAANAQTLQFELQVTNSAGLTDTDVIDVRVQPRTAPQSFAVIEGTRSSTLLPTDGVFAAYPIALGTDRAFVQWKSGIDSWSFEFGNASGVPLTPGTYTVTGSGNPPTFNIADFVQCGITDARGTFTIRDIAYAGDMPTRLAVDFDQTCGSRNFRGKLRFNVQLPDANAGADATQMGRSSVTLAAGASAPVSGGSISSYAWHQVSGPAVTLSGANTASASFTAPDVSATTTFEFQLSVVDNRGIEATDNKIVTVDPAPAAPPGGSSSGGGAGSSGGGGGGGGAWDWLSLCALGLLLMARRSFHGGVA